MNQKTPEGEVKEKTPAELRQEERDKITAVKSENDVTKDDEEENTDEKKEEELEEEKEDKKDDDEKDDDKDDKEKSEKEDEEKDETDDTENDPEKLKKSIARLQKRIGTKTNSEKVLKQQLKDLEAKLAAIQEEGKETLTEADVEDRAKKLAEQRKIEEDFEAACKRLSDEGKKADPEFESKVVELGEDYGKIPAHMIDILDTTERGGAVLNYLCDNPDEYEEIRLMRPGKMAKKLLEISELVKPKKPQKEISKVPNPPKPVNTNKGGDDSIVITGKETQEEFNRKRALQREKKMNMKRY